MLVIGFKLFLTVAEKIAIISLLSVLRYSIEY